MVIVLMLVACFLGICATDSYIDILQQATSKARHTSTRVTLAFSKSTYLTSTHVTIARVASQPENPFSKLVQDQSIAVLPEVALECGDVLHQVPIAYKTWGELNETGITLWLFAML